MSIVSIIIPVFNREKIISKTLNSLKKQSHRPLEIIIIDDASTDNSFEEIKKFIKKNLKKDFKLHLYKNKKNRGACFSRNIGISFSRGKYIQFLDSDDFIHEGKIKKQADLIEKNKSNIVISDYSYVKNKKVIRNCKNNGNIFKRIALGWSIYTSTPLIRSSLIKKKLKWNEKIDFLQDKDFLFKVLMLSGEYSYLPGFTSYYMQHNNSQISDSYLTKKPQFFTMINSRIFFLYSNLLILKKKCIFYTCLGIVEIFFQ